MRRELKAAIDEVREMGYPMVASYMESNGYIPSADEISLMIPKTAGVRLCSAGMPIADSGSIELTALDMEMIEDAFIDRESGRVLCSTAEGHRWLPIVESSYDKSLYEAQEVYRAAYNAVADELDAEGIYDMDPFLSPNAEVYDSDVSCPNCNDIECFPTHVENGLQHYICNECGIDFVAVDPIEEEPETTEVPIDEYAHIEASIMEGEVDWSLIVEGNLIECGSTTGSLPDAVKVANLDYCRIYTAFAYEFDDGTEFMDSNGDCIRISARNDSYYMLKGASSDAEVVAGWEIADRLDSGEYIYAEAQEKPIDDIAVGDRFASDEGTYTVDSRTRNIIYCTYEPYNDVITASESTMAFRAYDFCRMAMHLDRF